MPLRAKAQRTGRQQITCQVRLTWRGALASSSSSFVLLPLFSSAWEEPHTTVMLDGTEGSALSSAYSLLYMHSQTFSQLCEVGIFPAVPMRKLLKEAK